MRRTRKVHTGQCVNAWLKFPPWHATCLDGTAILSKPYRTAVEKEGHYRRLLQHIYMRIANNMIWQAKVYIHPGNREAFSWNHRDGEVKGKGSLLIAQAQVDLSIDRDEMYHMMDQFEKKWSDT
ncbi:MAG: hypothetical protein AAF242_05290 [Bacteroidota bacterium]